MTTKKEEKPNYVGTLILFLLMILFINNICEYIVNLLQSIFNEVKITVIY